MAIDWTGYARIRLGNGVTISVNSETSGSASAHGKVVDAIIKAVAQIENSDKGADGESDKMHATDVAIETTDGEDDPIPTLVGADAPAEENCSEGGSMPGARTTDGNPKPEVPAGNPPALLNESAPESKPRLLIDIAKSTYSSGGEMEAISLTFHHLHEAMEGNKLWGKHAAAHFVECIGSFKFDNVLVFTMDNYQVIMAGASASCPVGHDKLVELAKQAIARTAMADEVADYAVSVR